MFCHGIKSICVAINLLFFNFNLISTELYNSLEKAVLNMLQGHIIVGNSHIPLKGYPVIFFACFGLTFPFKYRRLQLEIILFISLNVSLLLYAGQAKRLASKNDSDDISEKISMNMS